MSILDRYLAVAVLKAAVLALMVLLALLGFISLIKHLGYVGQGSFALSDAFILTLMVMPRFAVEVLPIAVLTGALLGLGALANGSELVVMRAAGVSPLRLGRSMAITGLGLAFATFLLGEVVAPPADALARQYRSERRDNNPDAGGLAGAWLRDGERLLNVVQQPGADSDGDVYTYEFNGDGRLVAMGRAGSARLDDDGSLWNLSGYSVTRFEGHRVSVDDIGVAELPTDVGQEVMESAAVDPNELPALNLLQQVRYLRSNDLDATAWELALWSRVTNPIAVAAMALLALPFVFGPLRSGGNGARLVLGVLVGVGYFLMTGVMAGSASVYGIPAAATAWAPVLVILAVAGLGVLRVR